MRRLLLFFAFLAAFWLSPRTSAAGEPEIEIDLLVMGPGDHLYTRGGHAAVMVAEIDEGELVRSTVYNYGDTDWDDPMLVPHFLRGDLTFFLSDTGSIESTLQEYGVRQGREISRLRLHLTRDQAADVARRLREGIEPGKREYTFHHVHALCSTRIMDLLDDVLGGRLRVELQGRPGPDTGRRYQERIFSDSLLATIGGDLFIGRLHDRVLDRWESTASPAHMAEYLQSIYVPLHPGSTEMVPLAEPPVLLVARKTPLVPEKSWASHVLWGALIALLIGASASALRQARSASGGPKSEPRRAGEARALAAKIVLWSAAISGVIGVVLLGFLTLSRVPEFRQNELILVFWPTDLWLAWQARRWMKGASLPSAFASTYATARLAVAGLAVIGHAAGLLVQEPRIVLALGVVEAAALFTMIRALRSTAAAAEKPAIVLTSTPAKAR